MEALSSTNAIKIIWVVYHVPTRNHYHKIVSRELKLHSISTETSNQQQKTHFRSDPPFSRYKSIAVLLSVKFLRGTTATRKEFEEVDPEGVCSCIKGE